MELFTAPPPPTKSEVLAKVLWALHRWERGHLPWDSIPAYIGVVSDEDMVRMEPILDLEPQADGFLYEPDLIRIVARALRH